MVSRGAAMTKRTAKEEFELYPKITEFIKVISRLMTPDYRIIMKASYDNIYLELEMNSDESISLEMNDERMEFIKEAYKLAKEKAETYKMLKEEMEQEKKNENNKD
jgi:glycyl-tRNA synthetase alpha subunit